MKKRENLDINASGFSCNQCGLCCQNINHIPELKTFDLGSGTCKHFDAQSKQCLIYDDRPDICQIDVMYDKHYYKIYDKQTFYKLNQQVCKQLQDESEAQIY